MDNASKRSRIPAPALAALLLLACGLPSLARATEVRRLDNGLTLVFKENRSAPVVAVRVYVKTGSMLEGKYAGAGISHVLEHLVHGATTPKRTEEESRRLLESIGNNSNAYTTKEHTCYYINTASRYLDIALDLLSDWLGNAVFPQNEFDREIEVVQRELEKGQVEPRRVLHMTYDRLMFQNHPCGLPTIGYLDILRGITRDEIVAYYHRTYAPGNMVVAVAGDVSADEAARKVADAFGKIKGRPLLVESLPPEPPQLVPRRQAKEMDVQIAYVMMGFRTVPISSPDMYPLDVASHILSNGDSSRLVRVIKDEKQLVHSIVSYSYTPEYDGGQFVISYRLDADKLDAAEKAILAELDALKKDLVTTEELAKAKRQKAAENVFGRQTAEDQAGDIAMSLLSTADPDFSDVYVSQIQKVTREQIRAAAQKYFDPNSLCVSVVRPRTQTAAAAQKPAAVEQARPLRTVLPNGLRVIAKRAAAAPMVSLQAYWLAGVRFEDEKNNGVSRFTAEVMVKGAKTRSAQQIAETFDAMGGDLASSSGNNAMYATATVLKDDLPTALDLFADVIMNPVFPPDEIEKMRLNLLAAIRAREDSWERELMHFFRTSFFKTSPYRFDVLGSAESVKSLTQKDLRAWHAACCVPNNMVVTVVGDIDPQAASAQVAEAFGRFQNNPDFKPPAPPAEPPLKADATFTKHTRKEQAAIFIGFSGLRIADADRDAMDVLDAVLSGADFPTGWLHSELRGKGLVYLVHATNWVGLEPGYFGAYAACQPDKADEVIRIMLQKFEDAKGDKITPEELERAKRMCVTSHELGLQRPSAQAAQMALDELYGLGYDFGEKYAARINGVTMDDVRRVARKYLTHHAVVTVTPAK